mgnify:CR=1 FL=1
MPTGYTAGIIDGTIENFEDYAKLCTRAFMVHLREEPFNSEYIPRTPSDYHVKAINKAKEQLKEVEVLEDSTIIEREKLRLLNSVKYHKEEIEKDKIKKERLNLFLRKAKSFIPPTETHKGIADFLVNQIKETIDFDCNSNYHIDELSKVKKQLLEINAEDLRGELRTKATEDLAYHTKEHEAELKRCRESNKWYDDFVEALKPLANA